MSQMMHIVRKDVRRLRWLLALGLVVLITRVALVVNGASAADESVATGLLLQQVWETMAIIELLLMAAIVAQLVLEEPLVGLTPFWLTRPYATRSLLAEKLLFAVIALVVLPSIADAVTMSLFHVGPRAIVSACAAAVLGYASWMLSLMVVAALTPSLGAFVLTTLGVAAVSSLLPSVLFGFRGIWTAPMPGYTPPSAPDATPFVVFMAVYLGAALSVVIYQYRHRRWRVAAALAVAGIAVTVVVPAIWPWSFARGEQVRPGEWASNVVVAYDPSWGTKASDVTNVSRQTGERWRQVSARLVVSGLPPQMMVRSVGIRSKAQMPDSAVLESGQMGPYGYQFTLPAAQAALKARILATRDFEEQPRWSPVLTIREQAFVQHRGKSGRLDSDIDVWVSEVREVGALPLTSGASLDRGVSRIEIAAVQRGIDSRDVVIRRWGARSPMSVEPAGERYFALRNRSIGQALMAGIANSWQVGERPNAAFRLVALPFAFFRSPIYRSGDGFSVGTQYLRFPGRGYGTDPNLNIAAFEDAELVVLEVVPAGVVTRRLTIDPFLIPST